MTLLDLIALLKAFFQFPKTIQAFAKTLQDTPQEKHEELMQIVADAKKKFNETGRPTWKH